VARCSSCHAEIVWGRTATGHKAMPLDAEPDPNGLWALDGNNTVFKATDLVVAALGDGPRYTSHFATCPNAASHRKKKEPT
jgi:hypothetical protein